MEDASTVTLSEHIAQVLAPHMGQATATAVAIHVCAKFGAGGNGDVSEEDRPKLADFLRRGLVAYVGAEKATELASACLKKPD